jgi:Immunoglobulin-like domain of bacterial spore germination/Sporulation and spore germination
MDDLTTLLHDAVDDLEPTDRLGAIREQTRKPSRTRWYAVGGAVLATAAVVTGIGIAIRPSADPGPGPFTQPTSVDTPTAGARAVPVYYLGATSHGVRLYREFHQQAFSSELDAAVHELGSTPEDPDYTTYWRPGTLHNAVIRDGVIRVEVASTAHDRPADLSAKEAELSVQQVVYTLQAAVGQRLPVQFVVGENTVDQVLGVPTSEPLTNAAELKTLALVSISDPEEGRVVQGSFRASGRAASFEGVVPWELHDSGGAIVRQGFAQGEMADHLTPWETRIDVSGLAPGSYTFFAMTDNASGDEGPGVYLDTRTVIVR